MRGITFNHSGPVGQNDTHRMDVVCFIGFVPLKTDMRIPAASQRWWHAHGWRDTGTGAPDLWDRPYPVESWDAFQSLFDERRLTHQARLQSQALDDPLTISQADATLHLIVDQQCKKIELEAAAGSLALSDLVDQLNQGFQAKLDGRAAARLDGAGGPARLVIKRTDRQRAGELTVFANPSLGFPASIQDDDGYLDNYLAAAVRAFFREGGRKCYLIPMGVPLPYAAGQTARFKQVLQLFWGPALTKSLSDSAALRLEDLIDYPLPGLVDGRQDMEKRQSLAHLIDLTDVTYVCFPDLVELFSAGVIEMAQRPRQPREEVFVVCSQNETAGPWFYVTPYQAPALPKQGYRIWNRFIDLTLGFLDAHAPHTQLVASLPLPDNSAAKDFEPFVATELLETGAEKDGLYRRLQLTYPWLKTDQSGNLPQSTEPPEGTLAGLLATGAILDGAYRSIAGTGTRSVYDLMPLDFDACTPLADTGLSFNKRISVFDFVPAGIELQSDVTAVNTPAYRYAVVRRIMILVQRAAAMLGLNYVFETSDPRTWESIENTFSALLMNIYQQNGLWGATADKAFAVVCDRSTMTQNDIDNGRFIVNITMQPAVPIEQIKVNLTIAKGNVRTSV